MTEFVAAWECITSKRFRSPYCREGTGRAPDRCPGCKGPVMIRWGLWAVMHWRGDNRYEPQDAVRWYKSYPAAKRYAATHDLIVRFIPDDAHRPRVYKREEGS